MDRLRIMWRTSSSCKKFCGFEPSDENEELNVLDMYFKFFGYKATENVSRFYFCKKIRFKNLESERSRSAKILTIRNLKLKMEM